MLRNKIFNGILTGIVAGLALFGVTPPQKKREPSPEDIQAGYELSDLSVKAIAWVGIGLIVGAVLMHLGLGVTFFFLRRVEQRQAITRIEPSLLSQRTEPPKPRLQTNPPADLNAYLEKENHLLSTYGWVDSAKGVARIPIQRAMELRAKGAQ